MKISSISTMLIHIPYETGGATQLAGQSWTHMAILLVKVETDDGVTGWGEGFGHAIAAATKATLDTMVAQHFIGRELKDPRHGGDRSAQLMPTADKQRQHQLPGL